MPSSQFLSLGGLVQGITLGPTALAAEAGADDRSAPAVRAAYPTSPYGLYRRSVILQSPQQVLGLRSKMSGPGDASGAAARVFSQAERQPSLEDPFAPMTASGTRLADSATAALASAEPDVTALIMDEEDEAEAADPYSEFVRHAGPGSYLVQAAAGIAASGPFGIAVANAAPLLRTPLQTVPGSLTGVAVGSATAAAGRAAAAGDAAPGAEGPSAGPGPSSASSPAASPLPSGSLGSRPLREGAGPDLSFIDPLHALSI